MKINKKQLFIIIIPAIVVVLHLVGKSFADTLENDVKVAGNSELTYYLKISLWFSVLGMTFISFVLFSMFIFK